jgi:hypothetical protein
MYEDDLLFMHMSSLCAVCQGTFLLGGGDSERLDVCEAIFRAIADLVDCANQCIVCSSFSLCLQGICASAAYKIKMFKILRFC